MRHHRRNDLPSSYAGWSAYLDKARNGHDRPIGGSASKRVIRGPGETIMLRLHATDCVILYPDGSQVINTGGWKTVTTLAFINQHSAASVSRERWQLSVRTDTPEITPARVQKCRVCHGAGRVPRECHAIRCSVYGGRPCRHGRVRSHRASCPHGLLSPVRGWMASHPDGTSPCYRCGETGRVDYGSRQVHYAWDGGPLVIDADGEPIGPAYRVPRASEGERVTRRRRTVLHQGLWDDVAPRRPWRDAPGRGLTFTFVTDAPPRGLDDEIYPRVPDELQDATHRYASHGAYAADLADKPITWDEITSDAADPYAPEGDLLDRIDDLLQSE